MAQNTAPIFTATPNIGFTTMGATQNTDWTMTTGTSHSLFTAGASGSYITKIRFKPSGSTTNANVVRVYINNGNTTTTATNNTLFGEISIPAITVSTTLAQNDFEIPINIAVPASYRLYAVNGGASLTGGIFATTVGGDY